MIIVKRLKVYFGYGFKGFSPLIIVPCYIWVCQERMAKEAHSPHGQEWKKQKRPGSHSPLQAPNDLTIGPASWRFHHFPVAPWAEDTKL
jgi:hypothetical protein